MGVSGTVAVKIRIYGESSVDNTVREAEAEVGGLERRLDALSGRLVDVGVRGRAGFADLALGVSSVINIVETAGRAVGAVVEATLEGARAADRMEVLKQSIEGFEGLVERVRTKTSGMIPTSEITRAISLFNSFNLPLQNIDAVLEEVAKTAIRTGESAEFLTQSLITGVARLSPQIIDNLGVTVKLGEVQEAAAQKAGVLTEALTDQQVKLELLDQVVTQLSSKNEAVVLAESQTTAVERLSASWSELGTILTQEIAASPLIGWMDEATSGLAKFMRTAQEVRQVLEDGGTELDVFAERFELLADRLGSESIRGSGASQGVIEAQLAARDAAAAQATADREERVRTLNRLVEQGLISQEEAARRLVSLELDRLQVVREAAEAAREGAEERVRVEEEAARARSEALDAARDAVAAADDAIAAARGESDVRQQIRIHQTEINRLMKEGTAESLSMAAALKQTLAGLIEIETSQRRGGGGGGRRRTPATEADRFAAELAERELARARELATLDDDARAAAEIELDIAREREQFTLRSLQNSEKRQTTEKAALEESKNHDQMQTRILSIEERRGELQERRLRAATAEAEAAAAAARAEQARVEAVRQGLGLDQVSQGERIEAAFGEGAITAGERAALLAQEADRAEKELHEARLERAGEVIDIFGDVSKAATESGDEATQALGRVLSAVQAEFSALTGSTDEVIAAIGRISAAAIEDKTAQAAINAAFYAASAIVAFATEQYDKGAAYAAAAAMYATIAGTSAAAAGAPGQRGGSGSRATFQSAEPVATDPGGAATVFVFNSPVVGGTPQEIAAQLEKFKSASGAAMGEAA